MPTPWYDFVSVAALVICAGLSFILFIARRRAAAGKSSFLWLLFSAGFIYLACDEAFDIHSRLDWWVHRTLGMAETGWTDRLDDLVLLIYLGLASVVV